MGKHSLLVPHKQSVLWDPQHCPHAGLTLQTIQLQQHCPTVSPNTIVHNTSQALYLHLFNDLHILCFSFTSVHFLVSMVLWCDNNDNFLSVWHGYGYTVTMLILPRSVMLLLLLLLLLQSKYETRYCQIHTQHTAVSKHRKTCCCCTF